MGATFANSTSPHLLDFEMNLSTPIPNHIHTRTRARARTARMEEHVTKYAMFSIDSK